MQQLLPNSHVFLRAIVIKNMQEYVQECAFFVQYA